ncbi:MAG: hypothetical protein M3Y32_09170 [Pseudomonadota bacterium]|nr:hypothetical protein [Pseudomonadota bacterium]
MRRLLPVLLFPLALSLSGCDLLGIEGASVLAARREAEGRAVGAGCRQAARSVEQCYGQNKRAEKAAVFAGWREMNDYMRENKLEAMPSLPEPDSTVAAAAETDDSGEKPAKDASKESSKDSGKDSAKVSPKDSAKNRH